MRARGNVGAAQRAKGIPGFGACFVRRLGGSLPYEEHLSLRSVPAARRQTWQKASHPRGGTAILIIAYYITGRGETYRELGGDYFDRANCEGLKRYLVRKLERLGHKVTLEPAPSAV